MNHALDDGASSTSTKGMVQIDLYNRNTGTSRVLGIAYKKGSRDIGVMMNFCPFCGTRFEIKTKEE